jgi:hypothetical protein
MSNAQLPQHLEPYLNEMRKSVRCLYLELPVSVADDVKSRFTILETRLEAYQSLVDKVLDKVIETTEDTNLSLAAKLLRREPATPA